VTLTDSKKNFKIEVEPDSSTVDGILQFNCGKSTLPVHVANVTMVKKTGTSVRQLLQGRGATGVSFVRTGNMLHWTSPSASAQASLVTLSGKTVQFAKANNAIKLAHIPEGMYLLAIKADGYLKTFKIVK